MILSITLLICGYIYGQYKYHEGYDKAIVHMKKAKVKRK